MKVGIIVYPGSNCDKDTYNYFTHHGCECFYIWHQEQQLEKHIDLLVLPGGFAYGDRLYDKATGDYTMEPGKMASSCPVKDIIKSGHDKQWVTKIQNLLYISEYKRRQAPPGVKISSKNFGKDRRYPITNNFRDKS